MQGMHAAREVIEAIQALERDAGVDVIVVARGGGSVEDLLPFSDEALIRAVTDPRPRSSRRSGTSPTPRSSTSSPTSVPRRPPTRRSGWCPTWPRRPSGCCRRASAAGWRSAGSIDRELRQLGRALPPGPGRPAHRTRRSAGSRSTGYATGPGVPSATGSTAARTTSCHQLARIRALSPLATLRRGYAVLSDAEGQALSSVATLEPGQDIHIRVADGRIGATTTTVDRIDLMPDAERRTEDDDD